MEYRKRSVSQLVLDEEAGILYTADNGAVRSYYFCCLCRCIRRLFCKIDREDERE